MRFHMEWLFLLMPLSKESDIYFYFLSGNKYELNITRKNIRQIQCCINLLPLALV